MDGKPPPRTPNGCVSTSELCARTEDRALPVGRRHPQRRILSRRIAGLGGEAVARRIQLPLDRVRRRLYRRLAGHHHARRRPGNGALSAANKALTEPADTALRSLRNYTNFLIPEGGFGSSDTWSAIVLWLRNVLLNWLVFAPVLLALAIVPLLYRELLWDVSPFWGVAALLRRASPAC